MSAPSILMHEDEANKLIYDALMNASRRLDARPVPPLLAPSRLDLARPYDGAQGYAVTPIRNSPGREDWWPPITASSRGNVGPEVANRPIPDLNNIAAASNSQGQPDNSLGVGSQVQFSSQKRSEASTWRNPSSSQMSEELQTEFMEWRRSRIGCTSEARHPRQGTLTPSQSARRYEVS